MKALLALAFLAGCGDCLPSSLATPASVAVSGAPAGDVVVAHSADRVRAAGSDAAAFAAATDFRVSDVAMVRAGEDRQRLAGSQTSGDRVTLYYVATCSPCGGGNPRSYADAEAADAARRAPRTDLVRIPKGARVEIKACDARCGACPTNVP